ncbi:hypothetical protein JXA85_05295 [Candidatus Woesearchaeota archaeon]|nr:hypothetical protein [Candidatus Woesearchaeota archaeon]
MSGITILLFFIYTYGLGYSLLRFVKEEEAFWERQIMRAGIGLGAFIVLGLLMNLLRIPLDWKIFLVLSLAFPVYDLIKKKGMTTPDLRPTKNNLIILVVLVLFFATLHMYAKGSFVYPYFEDDDPWHHAAGMKYVAIEKNLFPPLNTLMYIDPYPPAYDMVMGILNQTSSSVMWTLKFFNSLIISLSIVFFYFFAKRFMNNSRRALFSAFALAAIPCFLSHFIWSMALTVPMYFVAFYSIEMMKRDRKWLIPSIIMSAATLTISPSHSAYFGILLFFYAITRCVLEKKIVKNLFLVGIFGIVLSLFLWWGPMMVKYGVSGFFSSTINVQGGDTIFSVAGSADRIYSFNDFFIAKKQNMINNPIGVGIFLSTLAIISMISVLSKWKSLKKESNHWIAIGAAWFLIMLYFVNATPYPVKITPFRAWMVFAIPVAIVSAEGLDFLTGIGKKAGIPPLIIIALAVFGIIMTSAVQKYAVNTANWSPGLGWYSYPEVLSYEYLRELPYNAAVFTFTDNLFVISYDKYSCEWCPDIDEYRKTAFDRTAVELNSWLKSKKYEYLLIDGRTLRNFGINETTIKAQELVSSDLFIPVKQSESFLALRVV